MEATKTLVHAFVSSRLDYCNSVLAGVSGQLLRRLQVIQNAAARLVTGVRKSSSSRMRVMNYNWSATKHSLHLQSVAEISRQSV